MHFIYQRSDPFKSRKCEGGDCPVCREDGKGTCDRQSVTYNIKFAECISEKHQGARTLEEKNT